MMVDCVGHIPKSWNYIRVKLETSYVTRHLARRTQISRSSGRMLVPLARINHRYPVRCGFNLPMESYFKSRPTNTVFAQHIGDLKQLHIE